MNIKFKIDYKDFLNFYTSATYKTERFNKIVKYTWLFILLIVAFVVLVSSENKFRVIALIIAILVSIFIKFFMKVFYKNMIIAGLNRKESTYMFKDTPEEYDFINLLKEKTNKTVSNLYPQFLLYK